MTAAAVRIHGINGRGVLAFCEYHDGSSIRVRYRPPGKGARWTCDDCGKQPVPECDHARAVNYAVQARAALDHQEDDV